MPSCELCGQDTDSTKKVKIEGAKLSVCSSCAEMGKEVSTQTKKKKTKTTATNRNNQKVLANDYGKKIKQARESEQISVKELSDELNEKKSLISKLEKQDLKPDRTLASKLSERLGIDLYTNPEVSEYSDTETDSRKATLEDVAEVKD